MRYLQRRGGWQFDRMYLLLALHISIIIFTATLTNRVLSHRSSASYESTEPVVLVHGSTYFNVLNAGLVEDPMPEPAVDKVTYTFNTHAYDYLYEALDIATRRLDTPAEISDVITAGEVFERAGVTSQCYTYMAWQMITNKRSPQYAWRESLFPDWNADTGSVNAFDDEGFGIVDGRYVVATTAKSDGGIGEVGQSLDVVLTDGTVIPCIIGEVKSSSDSNWCPYGHITSNGSISIVEFCVDYGMWYNTDHANPGRPSCKPEWAAPLDYIQLY